MDGFVKHMKDDKGYGFIRAEDGKDYFFLATSVTSQDFDSMRPMEDVSFTPLQHERGPRAVGVIRRGLAA